MLDKLAQAKIISGRDGMREKRMVINMATGTSSLSDSDLVRVTLLRPKSPKDDLIQCEEIPIDIQDIKDYDTTNRTGMICETLILRLP